MKFKFLEDIATADLAFEAYGRDYSELFENAGLAIGSAMVDLKDIAPSRVYKKSINSDTIENLLLSYLSELIFLKDAKLFLAGKISCKVTRKESRWNLEAILSGEKIDRQKHKLGVDVKAVTKHLFKIEQLPNKIFHCQIVLDV